MSRGGMSRNPFGSHKSVARLDLLESLPASQVCGEKLLYLSVIQDAVQHYLFFGLGKNGTTPEGFVEACNYFFKARSSDPTTWYPNKYRLQTAETQGKKEIKVVKITDTQLKLCCFDIQYTNSGLEDYMPIERFIKWLQYERQKLLLENFEQVRKYIDDLMAIETIGLKVGSQLPLKVTTTNIVGILTNPEGPEQVARLLLLSKSLKPPRKIKKTRQRSTKKRKVS